MDAHKRKRDDDGTVVTFYAPDRTFARVYKGQSLEETKDLVRKKLGISEDTFLRFARLHEGKIIELDDEEDFEAFRHLARHVPTLDVSVFVGQNGPSIFSQQTPGESSAHPNASNKRVKYRRAMPSASIVSDEPPPRDVTSRREQMSDALDAASTLDANGAPKKKRKRKETSSQSELAVSSVAHPSATSQSEPEGHEPSTKSKKCDIKPPPHATSSIVPSLSASQDTTPSLAKAPGPSKSSKRKRQDTPESPVVPGRAASAVASSSIPSRPSSPSSPVKKRRRKEKRAEDAAPAASIEKRSAARSDKKGKRKADDTLLAPAEVVLALAANAGDDVAARKAARKARREREAKDRQAAETMEKAVSSKEDGKPAKKRISKDTEKAQATDVVPSTCQIPAEVELASKKDKRKKPIEVATELRMTPVDVSISVVLPGDTSAKSGKQKKSKTKARQSDQLTVADADKVDPATGPLTAAGVEADREPNGMAALNNSRIGVNATEAGRTKRRKTLSTAAGSTVDAQGTAPTVDPPEASSVEGAAIPDAQGGSRSSSAKKSKGDRKKSLPASSSEPAETSPTSGMSVVQAAAEAILARVLSTSAGPPPVLPSQQPTPPSAESTVPTQKRKAARSKLSQAWGPDDLAEEQEQAPVPAKVPSPSSIARETPATSTLYAKQAKRKKVLRPSSAPTCPICDKVALHPRSQCPIVEAGPAAIRKRITEVKKSGHSELVEELQILFKEAQRRRKSAGARYAAEVTVPASVPALDVPGRERPSSPDVPPQSVSISSQSRPKLGDRSLSSPRVPAGSEISEVVVQNGDEGSSNESSSDDDDDDDKGSAASPFPPLSSSLYLPNPDNLEALLYGPVKPRVSVLAQIPSSSEYSSSGEGSDGEAEKDEDVDMDEDEKNDRAFRRMSRKFARAASSSDEDEPQPEPDQELDAAETAMDDSLVPPPKIGPDPSTSMDTEDAQQVEADVLAQDTSVVERSVEQSHAALKDGDDSAEGEDQTEDKANAPSEAELDEEAESKPAANLEDQPSESEADERNPSPANRGDDHCVEPGAEVDPLASQEHLEVSVEVSEEPEGPEGAVDVDEELEPHSAEIDEAEVSVEVSKLSRGSEPKLSVDLSQKRTSNDDDPEVGASPGEASADLSGTTAQAELEKVAAPFDDQDYGDGEGNQDFMEVEVFEPHTEDPDDPIDTFSSDHDREQRDVLEDDPIEDPDLTQERQRTPPPATPRTPGTVRRMKDRYGRVSHAQANACLSQQLLGDLVLPQQEITLATPPTGSGPEPSLELEIAPDVQAEVEGEAEVEKEAEVVEPAKTEEETASSQSQSQPEQAAETVEARPRRTTRTTVHRTSSTGPSSSLPEPQATPTPVPAPRRRGGRLTAEEKAQREAQKAQKDAEKKVERERKAAEKAAVKAAKEAEKKAERERKAAERQAEKEAQQAEKQAKQKEKAPAKRGKSTRGRGGPTKPISTRSQRSLESVGPGEGVDEYGETEVIPSANHNATETPGVAKVSWAILPQSESRTQEGSVGETSMIDELQPSSPEAAPHRALVENLAIEDTVTQEPGEERENLPAVTPKPRGKKNPLFIPSSSQHPLTPFGLPNAESTPFTDGNGQDDSESDPGAEPDRTFKAPTRPRVSWASQSLYPSLTDLASQSLFSTTQIPSPAFFSQTPKQDASYKRSSAAYGKTKGDGDDDDDDESSDESDSSDSDSDKKKSHIPQNRRAGAGVQKKKQSGLLSGILG